MNASSGKLGVYSTQYWLSGFVLMRCVMNIYGQIADLIRRNVIVIVITVSGDV